jgi:hypothetical protein
MKQRIRSAVSALLVASLTVLALPAARAVIYIGNWDPPYGTPFTGPPPLGWRGSATFDLPSNCGVGPAFTGLVSFGTCTGSASVASALVEFYDASLPLTPTPPTVGTVSSVGPTVTISDLYFVGGQLEQISTGPFPWATPTPPDPLYQSPYSEFALQFVLSSQLVEGGYPYSGPVLASRICLRDCLTYMSDLENRENWPRDFRIRPAPEPASLALVVGALVAAGALRRRRFAAPLTDERAD